MNDNIRKALVRQGMGKVLLPIRCSVCNYLANTIEEELQLFRKGSPCPHCRATDKVARITLDNYLNVCNWIGEYATSSNNRDHVSATVMFCALVESIIEKIKNDYLLIHPDIALRIKDTEKVLLKDVFSKNLIQLLHSAPVDIKQFPDEWEIIRTKRNNFMHGHSGDLYINQKDALSAMDLSITAIRMFVWLNNKYCLNK